MNSWCDPSWVETTNASVQQAHCYWRCEKRDKPLCFLLCLLCYLYLDKTVFVFHFVHRTHLDEISYLNILIFPLLFKEQFWVLFIRCIKEKWKGTVNQRRGKNSLKILLLNFVEIEVQVFLDYGLQEVD